MLRLVISMVISWLFELCDLCGIYDLTNLLTGAVQIVCGVFDYLSYESRYRGY